ncbi:transporter substrate-binding domain-containing protein [Gordonia sp. LSe1-13]|uniref:Transporter substrate-binding domain-containing protein n=1 Tax=Gordonia sesuvii TaxID=3116777 RepID=A0ABU7MBT3_9ACTN|nr:transporter substrate-binding domain-containing protein [Gordonia sp. LSe1-13]
MTTSRTGRLVTTLVIVAVVASGCFGSDPRNLLDSIRDGSVVLGTKFDQPGLGIRNADESVTGFDPAVSTFVVARIADSLGVSEPRSRWRETPSTQRETLIDNGQVDMIAATYSITPERAEEVDFAGPYLVNYQGLLVRADDESITTLTDLDEGKTLCSVTGSTSAQNVTAQLPSVQLEEYDTASSCVEALRRGRVDALTTDEVILAGYENRYPGEFTLVDMTYPTDACVDGTLKRAGTPFSTERYGIGLGAGQSETVTAVNEALVTMMEPTADGRSPWERALRDAIGDAQVDRMIARAAEPGSPFDFTPDPGDLDFLEETTVPCETEPR